MKDAKVTTRTNGTAGLVKAGTEDTVLNNIWLSLAIRKGTWWLDPGFGLDWDPRAKLTPESPALLRERCLEALRWIIDLGRARSIEVTTERQGTHRIDILVEAVQADGREVTFEYFVEVA